MSAGKIIAWVVLSPLALIALGIAYCEVNKAYWDHKVRELCEKDGGVTVIEHVEISKAEFPGLEFTSSGAAILPSENRAKSDDAFYLSFKPEIILNDRPSVRKDEITLIRRSDNKVLGKQVYYGRRGGDFPTGISHDSSFGCTNIEGMNLDLTNSVISITRK